MRSRVYILFFILLSLLAADVQRLSAERETVIIEDIRYTFYPTRTRVVIDLDSEPLFRTERMVDSRLISIYFKNATLGEKLQNRPILLLQGALQTLEIQEEEGDVAVLLTFKEPKKHTISSLSNPDRLVIDVTHPKIEKPSKEPIAIPIPSPPVPPTPPTLSEPATTKTPSFQPSPSTPETLGSSGIRTIILDPGHGGDDTGAIGPTGLKESLVVLDVALSVKEMLEERLELNVLMTRDTDIFIPLKGRTDLANSKQVDLFVSIHANAAKRKSAQGIETYIFGRATDEMTLALVARENATDVKAVQDLQQLVLNDLLRDFVINEALELAHYTQESFINRLIPKYPTLSLGVKKAPFYVLAHTKMPAILTEISFVSNKIEEKRLRDKSYRQKIAESIFSGIKEYIEGKKNQQ
ncbi:MAG: N-acetylmuramoyl-L-alanine amidase [Nitrospirota bacterium]